MTKITYSIRQENSVSGWWRSSCDLSNIVHESTKQGIITIIIMLLIVLSVCLYTPFLHDASSLEPTVILTAQASKF